MTTNEKEIHCKTLNDLGKLVVAAGFATQFFKDSPGWLRVMLACIGLELFLLAVYVLHRKEKNHG
jgi:hypothetical protein